MVDQPCEKRYDRSEYSLSGLHRLAGFGQVNYTSRRVLRHVEDLGYKLNDVCDRLLQLKESDFQHSVRYSETGPWHDVYLLAHPVPSNPEERLYIKFRISSDCVFVDLCSFHPEGWT
jgi:hypothetical protein